MLPGGVLPEVVLHQLQQGQPGLDVESAICPNCVNKGKAGFLAEVLVGQLGELGVLDREVLARIQAGALVVDSALVEDDGMAAPAQAQLATRITQGVGSWRFVATIFAGLAIWIAVNVIARPFEPYPTVMLAVISATLGSLAALEGPVILMAQRFQAVRDRERARNEYRVNLRAELEVRYLNLKIDAMVKKQHLILTQLAAMNTTEKEQDDNDGSV